MLNQIKEGNHSSRIAELDYQRGGATIVITMRSDRVNSGVFGKLFPVNETTKDITVGVNRQHSDFSILMDDGHGKPDLPISVEDEAMNGGSNLVD